MRKFRVYIAGPMSQGDRIHNLYLALNAYDHLINAGFAPLCPQLTFLAEGVIRHDHQTWLSIDLPWVEMADAVLRLPGDSKGADQEVMHALTHKIPVFGTIDQLVNFFKERKHDVA